jgi:hypothetical protein
MYAGAAFAYGCMYVFILCVCVGFAAQFTADNVAHLGQKAFETKVAMASICVQR